MLPKFLPIIMLVSLTLTAFVEVIIAVILKVNTFKDILNVILANLLTNPLVVSVSYYVMITYNETFKNISLLVLEVLALIAEGTIFKKYLKYDKLNPFFLSLVLNVSSFVIVNIINLFIY